MSNPNYNKQTSPGYASKNAGGPKLPKGVPQSSAKLQKDTETPWPGASGPTQKSSRSTWNVPYVKTVAVQDGLIPKGATRTVMGRKVQHHSPDQPVTQDTGQVTTSFGDKYKATPSQEHEFDIEQRVMARRAASRANRGIDPKTGTPGYL